MYCKMLSFGRVKVTEFRVYVNPLSSLMHITTMSPLPYTFNLSVYI